MDMDKAIRSGVSGAGIVFATLLFAGCMVTPQRPGAPVSRAAPVTRTGTIGSTSETMGTTGDSQITRSVETRIAANTGLTSASIQVDTLNGVVTLSGIVNSEQARDIADQVAAHTAGVVRVVDNLQVSGS